MHTPRPLGVTLLAIFFAWLSFGLLSLALMVASRHSEMPLRLWPAALGVGASVVGIVLAHRLWRMRASAPTLVMVWAVLILAFAAFWPSISAPGDARRGAIAAVMLAVVVVSAGATAVIRYLKSVLGEPR